jgi:hypothetical protein
MRVEGRQRTYLEIGVGIFQSCPITARITIEIYAAVLIL